jgi:hypothetical protein
MTDTKPNCGDFIIATIRALRVNPANLKGGGRAGVRLGKIWAIASEIYSEEEFRPALNQLLGTELILATWHICQNVTREREGSPRSTRFGPWLTQKISAIPDQLPLTDRWYCRDPSGNITTSDKNLDRYDLIAKIKLYVPADGLPKTVANLERKRAGKTAQDIIATMKKTEG